MIMLLCGLSLAGDLATGLDAGESVRIVSATPFSLQVPYTYEWSADGIEVRSGTLLVLEVDPAWLVPRDVHVPVLYVGAVPAERLIADPTVGRLVVVVPGSFDGTTPIYFGGFTLPERVTAAEGVATLAAARARGAMAQPAGPSGVPVVLVDRRGLLAEGANAAAR